ncbi:ABC transporter permease [Aquisalimonas sp.]|uniref:ABC transporter permease n=1 Tax=unclassified Aquisalimonas TaxID=2644645 RepID=UPI0025C6D5C2|nr:ABC transporter permease [Aquisalimonas sp.]
MGQSLWVNRRLLARLTRREVAGRYRGSFLGLFWSFLHPLLMLLVFTFVFTVVFEARWAVEQPTTVHFALVLFSGLIVHAMLADVLTRAPGVVIGQANYVKKVVFPLELLPVVVVCSAAFHALVSGVILVLAFGLVNGYVHTTSLLAPVVLLPLLVVCLGVGWFLSSLGVFLRDIGQLTGVLATALLFLSPVFYPVSALPEFMQPWMVLNPLTFIIEALRDVLIWGRAPDWMGWSLYLLVSTGVAWAGFVWFQKTRRGFADVL